MDEVTESLSNRAQEFAAVSSSRRLTSRLSGKNGDVLLPVVAAADKKLSPDENKTKSLYQQARQQFLSQRKLLVVGALLIAVSGRLLIRHNNRVLGDLPAALFPSSSSAVVASESSTFVKLSSIEKNKENLPCEKGTSRISRPIVLDVNAIKSHPRTTLEKLAAFTEEVSYSRRLVNAPGVEAYVLLHYITQHYGDCRHVADVGTLYAASAMALGASGTPVRSYDRPWGAAKDRQKAFRGGTEEEWYTNVVAAGVEIAFHNVDLLKMPHKEFQSHFNTTWLVLIDTDHKPYSKPFEREFFQRLMDMNYKGIVLVDDIHGPGTFGGETERWWYELIDHTEERGYTCHDLTEVGHFSGTGLVDFSGMVKVIK